ncbi:MAG: NAD(P)H-binding protein [Planctomycetes bacterium]|nr:NAD(P)H-binding protein [Planctomycetota bacterium]
METDRIIVTGAFGYSGSYIARNLLDAGLAVRTLTNRPSDGHPLAGRVEALLLRFDDAARLRESLRGARVLINTYWVRFNHRRFTHAAAVENTLRLFDAAAAAGVQRVVHVSITNPSEDSPFEYFRGKARLERALAESGLSHAILRPAVLFGGRDILINNIAWSLRRLPVFGVPGRGGYRLQPIHVEDFAALACEAAQDRENRIINAVGPETFTFRELAATLAEILGVRRWIVSTPPSAALLVTRLIGRFVGDVVLTREEIGGLMAGLLAVSTPPTGKTKLTDWARRHANELGRQYASELARR